MSKKQIYIETYGCQMNVYDTELIRTILAKANYNLIDDEQAADVVMLNTCSVRDNANRRVFNRVHQIKQYRPEKPALVGILGCMATNFRKKLLEDKGLKIDFIAGPDSYKQLPELIENADVEGAKKFHVTLSEFETYSDVYPTRDSGVNAWIAVMRGCNNYCTFCVVPHTRGRERSRDPHNVVEEVQRLVQDGFKQVTLLGQNVNSYKHESYDFADLMAMVSDVEGIERIRFTSPHPKDFPVKFLNLMAERENICSQIHMPLQSGNSRILEKMNRTYTKEEFLNLAQLAKDTVPNIAMSTDVIVGFCSETDEEFEDTMSVMRDVEFDTAFMFKYSERPNTLASKRFKDDVPEEVKSARLTRLIDQQHAIGLRKNQAHIGRTETVLIEEETTKKDKDKYKTRNEANKVVIIPEGTYKKGDLIKVKITGATSTTLTGQPIH